MIRLRTGKPRLHGTTMTVAGVLEYLASGILQVELRAEFPNLIVMEILTRLAVVGLRERKVATLTVRPVKNQHPYGTHSAP